MQMTWTQEPQCVGGWYVPINAPTRRFKHRTIRSLGWHKQAMAQSYCCMGQYIQGTHMPAHRLTQEHPAGI